MIIKFVIGRNSADDVAGRFLKIENGKLTWTFWARDANSFPSRYAAKRYMKLVHPSETGWVVVQQ